jgi:hypothetical protein
LVRFTIASSDALSFTSATTSGSDAGAPISARTSASLSLLRPAIAHFTPLLFSRCSATRRPV